MTPCSQVAILLPFVTHVLQGRSVNTPRNQQEGGRRQNLEQLLTEVNYVASEASMVIINIIIIIIIVIKETHQRLWHREEGNFKKNLKQVLKLWTQGTWINLHFSSTACVLLKPLLFKYILFTAYTSVEISLICCTQDEKAETEKKSKDFRL